MIVRQKKNLPTEVKKYAKALRHLAVTRHIALGPSAHETLILLAGIICIAREERRERVFWVISLLLIRPKMQYIIKNAILVLPKEEQALLDVCECVIYYEKLAKLGHFVSFNKSTSKFNPITVIDICKQIGSSYKLYLTKYKDSFYTYPAKVFSAELLTLAGKEIKGKFGTFKDQHEDYQNELKTKIVSHDI